jgi:Flp pilus assembly pilin Flp
MDTAHETPTAPRAPRRRAAHTGERGASLVEYALLIALIAVVMIGAVTLLGDTASDSLDGSSSSLMDATG